MERLGFIFLTIILVCVLSSCSTTDMKPVYNLGSIGAYAVAVDSKSAEIEKVLKKNKNIYSEKEWGIINNNIQTWKYISKRLNSLETTGITAEEIDSLYKIGEDAYLKTRAIIVPKFDRLEIGDRLKFIDFEAYAKRLKQEVQSFRQDPTNDKAQKIGKFLLELANIAIIIAPKVLAVI